MSCAYLFLVLLQICAYISTGTTLFLPWKEEHQQCVAISHTNQQASDQSIVLSSQSTYCVDLSYISYFRDVLLNPPSLYHETLATTIIGLYNDFDISRKAYVHAHASLSRHSSSSLTPSLLYLPRTIDCSFLVPQVPPKSDWLIDCRTNTSACALDCASLPWTRQLFQRTRFIILSCLSHSSDQFLDHLILF